MKKRFWKIEYSLTIIAILAILLMLVPSNFIASKTVNYISMWNSTLNTVEYIFNAMNAQADSDLLKGLKEADAQKKEDIMLELIKPYLKVDIPLSKTYKIRYLNGIVVLPDSEYYFDKLYRTKTGKIIGVKDLHNQDIMKPTFILMFDVNGKKQPNMWGKDIFAINVFLDSHITPVGYGWNLEELKSDCSSAGSGVACSHYYRIGGEINE